jgi:hypothetical protein
LPLKSTRPYESLQELHQRFEAEGSWLHRVLEEMRLQVPGLRVDALFATDPSQSSLPPSGQ